MQGIEREYRLKVFVYAVLAICAIVWGISKVVSVHFTLIGM